MQPHEMLYWNGLQHATPHKRQERYYSTLARAFEFYESAVEDGRIKSYGITGTDSLLLSPKTWYGSVLQSVRQTGKRRRNEEEEAKRVAEIMSQGQPENQ